MIVILIREGVLNRMSGCFTEYSEKIVNYNFILRKKSVA
jgi:hypothetical protein